jgi:hypothetical protein
VSLFNLIANERSNRCCNVRLGSYTVAGIMIWVVVGGCVVSEPSFNYIFVARLKTWKGNLFELRQ